jgi:hypothetical protein
MITLQKHDDSENYNDILYKSFIGFDDTKYNLKLKSLNDSLNKLGFERKLRLEIIEHVFNFLIYHHKTKSNIGEIDLLIDKAISNCPLIEITKRDSINKLRYSLRSNDWLTGNIFNLTANDKSSTPFAPLLRVDNLYSAFNSATSLASNFSLEEDIKTVTRKVRAVFVKKRKKAERFKTEFDLDATEENQNHNHQLVYQEIEKIILAIKLTHENLEYEEIIEKVLPEVDYKFILACTGINKDDVNKLKRDLIDKISPNFKSIEIGKTQVKENLKIVESLSLSEIVESQTSESSLLGGILHTGITFGSNMARYTNTAEAIANLIEYAPKKTNKKIIEKIIDLYYEAEQADIQRSIESQKTSPTESPRSRDSSTQIMSSQQDSTDHNLFKKFIDFDDEKYNLPLKKLNGILIYCNVNQDQRGKILKHVFSSLIYHYKTKSNIGEIDSVIDDAIKNCPFLDTEQKKSIIEAIDLHKFVDPLQNARQQIVSKKSIIAPFLQLFRLENGYAICHNATSYSIDSAIDPVIKEAVKEVRDDFISKRKKAEKLKYDFEKHAIKTADKKQYKDPYNQDHQLVYQEIEKIILAIKLTHENLEYEEIIEKVLAQVDYKFISACIGLSTENNNQLKRNIIKKIKFDLPDFNSDLVKQNLKIVESLSLKELAEAQTSTSALIGSVVQAGLIVGCALTRFSDSVKSTLNHLELVPKTNHPKIIEDITKKYDDLKSLSLSKQSSCSIASDHEKPIIVETKCPPADSVPDASLPIELSTTDRNYTIFSSYLSSQEPSKNKTKRRDYISFLPEGLTEIEAAKPPIIEVNSDLCPTLQTRKSPGSEVSRKDLTGEAQGSIESVVSLRIKFFEIKALSEKSNSLILV